MTSIIHWHGETNIAYRVIVRTVNSLTPKVTPVSVAAAVGGADLRGGTATRAPAGEWEERPSRGKPAPARGMSTHACSAPGLEGGERSRAWRSERNRTMQRLLRPRRTPGLVVALLALLLASGGAAWAAERPTRASGGGHVIHACVQPYQPGDAAHELSLPAAGHGCPKGDTPISWNEKGQRGAQGSAGPRGKTGATGAQGPAGGAGANATAGSH